MKEEEKENGGSHQNGNNGNNGPGEEGTGEQGAGAPRVQGGGESRESGGKSGQGGGESGGGVPSGESGGGEQGNDSKADLLQRIRDKRAQGLHSASSAKDGTSPRNSKGLGGNDNGHKRGTKNDAGATPRANRDNGRGGSKDDNGNGGASETSQTNDAGRIKATGVNIKGVDKIKALAQQAAQAEAPKMKFTWDEKALSNKEGEEVLPKIKALLEFLFRHADKGLSMSNRNRAEAHVWSSIDSEDIDIIAGHLVEMGKASKIVATAVRRMTNSYRLLQIGLITLPKFIQTYQFYAANGGFALVPGKG